jgi:hypothetical protein
VQHRQFTGFTRVVRGVILGTALFVLTVAAHTAAHGRIQDLASTAWLLPVTILLSATLADRRRNVAWLVLYLLGAELILHLVLSVSLGHDGQGTSFTASPFMAVAHVTAAVLAALALHHADSLLHRWLDFLETLTTGRPLWPAAIPMWPAARVMVPSAQFTSRRETGWPALRAPPVTPA